MSPGPQSRGPRRALLTGLVLNLLLWTFIALLQSFQNYTGEIAEGGNPSFTRTLLLQIFTWVPWAFIAPLLYRHYRKDPLDRFLSVRTLLWLPVTATGCILVEVACHTWGMGVFSGGRWEHAAFLPTFGTMLRWLSFPALLVFSAIVGASHAAGYGSKFRERELRTKELERELTDARLSALRTQLQPHFFYNTLHSIASLVRERRGDAAVTMIARLGELFRYVLDRSDASRVSLEAELGFLRDYLDIEQVRFSDRLTVTVDAPGETLGAAVPPLILQPIVENAVGHGIALLSVPGTIAISARLLNGTLRIEIANDGKGLSPAWETRAAGAVGIRNTRSRLAHIYGAGCVFDIRETSGGRVTAAVSIPFEPYTPPGEKPS